MSMRFSLITLVALSAFASPSQAKILASAPTYGGAASINGAIVCRIFNAGTKVANISSRQIRANSNALITNSADSCNVPLNPRQYCAFSATIPGNLAFTCRIVATGDKLTLRGVAEVSTPAGAIVNTLPMQ